jgi:hypothetical protein
MGQWSNFVIQVQNYFAHFHLSALLAAFLGYWGIWLHQSRIIDRMNKSLGKSEMDQDLEHYAYQTRIDISFVVMLLGITNGLLAAILSVLLFQTWWVGTT